ncbi:MAG: YifB family Mg chelatase-like AAA ATPase [Treponema sp.]|jgi:magnesium chelatase family protein|nr:YifB family Mg chelatase-like AAA ATPase [Treponema sp.]
MFVTSYTPFGIDGVIIRVEADIRRGIPGIDITGLAQGAVKEAKERVRVAFRNSGFVFPSDRVLINLAPAGVRKEGAALDLPIAISVMAAAGIAPPPDNIMVLGELELSGSLRPVRGVLAATAAGLANGVDNFIVPIENADEARILTRNVAAVATLKDALDALVVRHETGSLPIVPVTPQNETDEQNKPSFAGDFAEVRGQAVYKRALEIAAAGGHNLLVFGTPGAGKTMLARRMPSIMPTLTPDEAVEVTRLHSLAGQLQGGLVTRPPFRSPHHSASAEGVLGGGKSVRPGEISLAHFGTLFMDEALQFRVNVLQALREPLEDRVISISRAEGQAHLPADFQLVMTANPCPCGKLGIENSACLCSPEEVHRYWRKFGGALMDRVELRVAVNSPIERIEKNVSLMGRNGEETSEQVAKRVAQVVTIQRERFKGTGVRRNARMTPALIEEHCALSEKAENVLRSAIDRLGASGRAFHGVIRVARTIADLEGGGAIQGCHIEEAVQYRRLGDDPYDILC